MTTLENSLALCLVKERFGDAARSVCSHLIKKRTYPLVLLANELNMDKKSVSQILSALIMNDIVEYKLNSKQIVEYKFRVKPALDLIKLPRFLMLANELFGKHAARIVEELILNGYLEMSSVVLKVLSREQSETSESDEKISSHYTNIVEAFQRLAESNLIQRVAGVELEHDGANGTTTNGVSQPKIPKLVSLSPFELYSVPTLKIKDSVKLQMAVEDEDNVISKCRAINDSFGDTGIYWKINQFRFCQYYRDRMMVQAVENRMDKNAANIIGVALKQVDARIETEHAKQTTHISKTTTSIDIQKTMKHEFRMESNIVDKYLNVILQDTFKVIDKVGDFSSGAYCFDFKKVFYGLCLSHIESYVRERYGSKSLRIFNVILEKSQLEQKQIEDLSMIPPKDCKALLYNMLNDGLLSLTELSKTSDHAPSRTIYLFCLDVYQIAKRILGNSYKCMTNLIIKREFLASENRRLLEKSKKVDTIVETLKSQGADQIEINEVKAMMSQDELTLLSSFNEHATKIELAEAQLVDTIFAFELYIYYHTVTPVIITGRGSK